MEQAAFTRDNFLTMLEDFITAYLTSPATPKLILFTNTPTLNQFTLLADLDVPTGSWYASKTAVITEVFRDDSDGSLNIGIESAIWNYTGSDPAEVINGVGLTDGSTNLFGAFYLAEPKTMSSVLDTLMSDTAAIKFLPVPS